MCVELKAHDKEGLSALLMIGIANAAMWMCLLSFPPAVKAQSVTDTQVAFRLQNQIDVLKDRQTESQLSVAVLVEKLGAVERAQIQIGAKLDTIITGIVALFGTILSGCGVAYFSLRMGWVSARA